MNAGSDGVVDGSAIGLREMTAAVEQRAGEEGEVLCVFNLSGDPVTWSPGNAFGKAVVVASEEAVGTMDALPGTLAPYTGLWAVLAD